MLGGEGAHLHLLMSPVVPGGSVVAPSDHHHVLARTAGGGWQAAGNGGCGPCSPWCGTSGPCRGPCGARRGAPRAVVQWRGGGACYGQTGLGAGGETVAALLHPARPLPGEEGHARLLARADVRAPGRHGEEEVEEVGKEEGR